MDMVGEVVHEHSEGAALLTASYPTEVGCRVSPLVDASFTSYRRSIHLEFVLGSIAKKGKDNRSLDVVGPRGEAEAGDGEGQEAKVAVREEEGQGCRRPT
ncbi:hypothetical protein U1Q18_049647 [Sarracenia purpurea var. burkii]